jgi:hypothetical protein
MSADKKVATNIKSGRKYTLDESGDLVEAAAGKDTEEKPGEDEG